MAFNSIQGYKKLHYDEGAKSVSVRASYNVTQRFPVPPRKFVNDPGSQANPHLRLMQNDPQPVTNDPRAFFESHNLVAPHEPTPSYALGIFQRNRDGSLTQAPTWHALQYKGDDHLGFFDSLSAAYRLGGLDLNRVAEQSVVGSTLNVTQITSRQPWDLPVENLRGAYTLEQIREWVNPKYGIYDGAEVDLQHGVLRLHFRCRGITLPDGRSFSVPDNHIDLMLGDLGLPADVFDSIYTGHDRRFRVDLVTFEERFDPRTMVRTMDRDPAIKQGSYEDDLVEGEPQLFFRFSTCRQVAIPLTKAIEVPNDCQVQVVRVRSAIHNEHLDRFNGREPGTAEWLPFDEKFHPGFLVPGGLHHDTDPASPGGSDYKDGQLLMSLSGQCFSADVTREVYNKKSRYTRSAQWFGIFDQLLFFGQRLKSLISWPFGPIANFARPFWVQTRGCASILYAKYLKTREALCTGSNFVVRGLWKQLFPREYLGLEGHTIWGTMLDHYDIITEDCNLSHGQKDYFGLVVKFTTLAKAIATSVDSFAQIILQRGRWLASILAYLATSYFYLRDTVTVRMAVNAASRLLPTQALKRGIRPMVPMFKSFGELLDRFNTNQWYIDAIGKSFISLFPNLYIFLGFKALVAGASFLAGPWLMMFIAWGAYANQSSKTGLSPKHVLPPWPRFIHMWTAIVPGVNRNAIHAQNVGSGQFGLTSGAKGKKIATFIKRQIVLTAAAAIGGGIYGTIALLYPAGLLTVSSALPFAGVLLGGLALQVIWDKVVDRLLPPEDERTLRHKAIDLGIRSVNLLGSMGLGWYFLAAGNPFAESISLPLLMNSFWGLFNGGGWLSGLRAYVISQKQHRETAEDEFARGRIKKDERTLLCSREGTDTWGSVLYEGFCLDLIAKLFRRGRTA